MQRDPFGKLCESNMSIRRDEEILNHHLRKEQQLQA